eukprot:jgi/Tetstr1/448129/TSEL_035422.t1
MNTLTHGVKPHGRRQLPSLHNAKVAAMIGLEVAATSAADHWLSGQEARFVAQEADLRELNQKAARLISANDVTGAEDSVTYDAFLSHSFRGAGTQELKRKLICELSRVREGGKKAGLVYWADYLDLAERGPVPWRREIEEGIRSSSKVLAFIDHAFLTSFNCIMELAAAFDMQKPVVPIILDEEAWSLLTTPTGADRVWDASEELRNYDGQEFLGGALFSKATLRAVFQRVSNINFCSCRSTDVAHWGIEYVSEHFFADVTKDLPYLKEWAQLNEQALKWHSSGRSRASLPRRTAVEKWVVWSDQAIKYNMEPPPTSLQREYIKESSRFFVRQKRALSVLAVAILLLILAGAIGSAVMGIRAQQAAAEARENAAIAEEKTHLAEEKSNLAVANQLLAERNANLTTVLLLSANPTPLTGREKRTLLKAMEVASKVDRLDMVMSQLQTAVRTLAYEPFWQYELEGHFEALTVKFSPDGGHLVSGGVNDKLRVWALKFSEGSFMPVPQAPAILGCVENGESLSVDWSVRGVIAGGTSSFNTVCLWKNDGKSWVLEDKIEGQGSANVWAVGFSPTGELLASGDDTGALFVWDVTTSPASLHAAFRFNTTDSPGDVRALAWTPDGTFIVAGGVNQVVSVVDLTTGATVASYPTHGDISDIRITVDKGEGSAWNRLRIMVASDRRDGVAYAYLFTLEHPVADHTMMLTLHQRIETTDTLRSVAWSPNGGDVVATSEESMANAVALWDFNRRLNSTTNEPLLSLTESGLVFDMMSKPRLMAWAEQTHGHPTLLDSLSQHTTLATATFAGPIVMLQSAPNLGELAPQLDQMQCTLAVDAGIKHAIRGVAVNTLLTQLATAAYHGSLCLYRRDTPTSTWAATHLLHANDTAGTQAKRVVTFSPNNKLLAVGSDEGRVIMYDVTGADPVELHSLATHEGPARVLTFDPSSAYIAAAADRNDPTVLIWEVDRPEVQVRLAGRHTISIKAVEWMAPFDASGRTVVVSAGDDGSIVLWTVRIAEGASLDVESSAVVGQLEEGARYTTIKMGANGLLAAGDTDGMVSLWAENGTTGKWERVRKYPSHSAQVAQVLWVADTLVSGGRDDSMNYIELEPGTQTVRRRFKTDTSCRLMTIIADGEDTSRLLCMRHGTDIVGHRHTDPTLLESSSAVELETVFVGFDVLFRLFQKMVYGQLSSADLEAMGFQDLTRLV